MEQINIRPAIEIHLGALVMANIELTERQKALAARIEQLEAELNATRDLLDMQAKPHE